MAWNSNLTNLNYVLAGLYPLPEEARRIVDIAGLPQAFIRFNPAAIDNWHAILNQADRRDKVAAVIDAARRDFPDNPSLELAALGRLTPVQPPRASGPLDWKADMTAGGAEQVMGKQPTFLPISFLEVGLQRARSIARVTRADQGTGTAFLTDDNVLVSNHHVLPTVESARSALVEFNVETTWDRLDLKAVAVELDPDAGFATSPYDEDDWTLVRVTGNVNEVWGSIPVTPRLVGPGDRVNIIQHPDGGPKQITMYHNVVTFADDRRVQYLTDTLPGASGAPVFDSRWRVVAVHHFGGWTREPGFEGRVFRNVGVAIGRIAAALREFSNSTN